MKIIKQNLKQAEVVVKAETADDLWLLSQIVEEGDFVSGKTLRKVKLERADSEKSSASKKMVWLKIEVEKLEYETDQLRIAGKVSEGPEDVPKGSYHSFEVEEGTIVTIEKKEWLKYQLNRLREASEEKELNILVVVMDREEALFALMKKYGYTLLSRMKGEVRKKDSDEKGKEFYPGIIKQIEEYDKRYNLERVIIASPAFWAEDLMKVLSNSDLKKKIVRAACSSADETAISEVLKRDEVKQVLQQQRFANELKLVEKLMAEISKKAKAVYGLSAVEQAAESGAIETLVVSGKLIEKARKKGEFARIDNVMKIADKTKAEIVIISSEHSGGKQLDGIGGIAALLRYKLSYE
jgi:protein pelota